MGSAEPIREFIVTELLTSAATQLADDDELLVSGLVDSIGALRLVAFIEERYSVKVPPADITIENFSSISTMVDYLQRMS